MPQTRRRPVDALTADRQREAAGVPRCPCCGERCWVTMPGSYPLTVLAGYGDDGQPRYELAALEISAPWCERCVGFVAALSPPPGKHVPDF